MLIPRSAGVAAIVLGLVSFGYAKNYRIAVGSAPVDRAGIVVSFALPADALRASTLEGAQGLILSLQIEGDGRATFLVPAQKAGETLMFAITDDARKPAAAGVAVKKERGRLHVMVAGAPLFDYQMDREALPRADIKPEFKRAGYIHPVFTPAGRIVTDDYPSNHVHHHGIGSPWTKTKFQGRAPDFWNMQLKTGAEDFVALDRTWEGPVHGGFDSRLRMIDLTAPTPVVALNETWHVVAYDVPAVAGRRPVGMFDLVITQTCATSDPLLLPTYHYGGFGFRGAGAWNGPGQAALFLTSDGSTDRIAANNTRGRWCYLGGKLDGDIAGTAILGHPENFRAPQPMRLHPDMPYLSFVPQQLGDFAIKPGQPYVARFRFVAADGAPDKTTIDEYWNGYAMPVAVRIEPEP